jgi:hypothetical protein
VELAARDQVDFPGWRVPASPSAPAIAASARRTPNVQDGVIRLGRVALGGETQLQLYAVIGSFGPADLMQLSARNPIEVDTMGENKQYVLSLVIPERAHSGSKTQFRCDNQPKKRGRPRGSSNKMSPAMKKMIVEVAEELGRVPYEDWDKIPCGDGVKGFIKSMAIRDLKVFLMLVCRCMPPAKRASLDRRPFSEK